MALSVTLPVSAPTNLSAALQAGGSLASNTTYYFIVIGYDTYRYTPAGGTFNYHSPVSEEGSFTTDETNKSVKINWTNSAGATRYQILLSTTSGDYTNSGGYGTSSEYINNSITSGTTGYTITALSTEPYVFHTCQIVNALPGNIDKNLGLLKVDFSDAGNITLDQVYNAIAAAGYDYYVSYDGYTFIIKGWFYAGGTNSGLFNPTQKRFIFIKGGVSNGSSTYIIRFGTLISDLVGASHGNGCSIDILNARAPFRSTYNKLQLYGSILSYGQSFYQKLTEKKTIGNFLFGTPYISGDISEIRGSISKMPSRDVTSTIKDTRLNQQNNYSSYPHIRCEIPSMTLMPYAKAGSFYDCQWFTYPNPFQHYAGSTWATSGYYTDFYDNEFVNYPNGMIGTNNTVGYTTLATPNPYTTSNQYVNINYSLTATVLNEEGNRLSGVTVSAVDASGNPAEFIEYDSTIDKLVTGVKYTGSVTTNANGQIGYYLKSYKIELNPYNTTYPTSYDVIKTNSYPYIITFSKIGYRDYAIILETLNKKTDMTLTLEDYEAPIYITANIEGNISPENLSGSISTQTISGAISDKTLSGTVSAEDI